MWCKKMHTVQDNSSQTLWVCSHDPFTFLWGSSKLLFLWVISNDICPIKKSDWEIILKIIWASFPAGTMEGAEEKKKKVPAVPETLKKKWKNFAALKIKRLRKKFAHKMLRKARRKLIKWIGLQASLWQNQQKANCPDRQRIDCLISWEIRNHLHGGSDSWDLYRWKMFQRSKQLPVAL